MDAKDQSHTLVLSEAPIEIINPSHIHPFVLRHNYTQRFNLIQTCILCEERCPKSYCCRACDFHLCPTCVNKNPLSVDPGKTHNHPLSFVPKFSFVFTCDACGIGKWGSSLCMCIPCCFAIHLHCVRLPRVICINRHDHRISLRLPLGSSPNQTCRVCRKKVKGEYGGYSCLTCSDYVVHSKCATDRYVWDGIELDGVPEEDPTEIMPFEMVDEGLIKHFGHEHNLRLTVFEEGDTLRSKQCSACVLPIYSDPCYICTHDCDFILHEVCANFLKKKRHPANAQRFTLYTFSDPNGYSSCACCERKITGFHYEGNYTSLHVLCASFQDGYVHVSHPHSELVVLNQSQSTVCSSCKRVTRFRDSYYTMRCIGCKDFSLCFRCLTLPKVVEHKYDKHPLSLCYDTSFGSGGYWCDICEKRLDPTKWYYTCREGNSTLHTDCVLGKDLVHRVGSIFNRVYMEFKVVHNNNATRPHCRICKSRCKAPILFRYENLSFCSTECVTCKWACTVCRTYGNQEVLYRCSGCKGSNLIGKG